MNILSIIPARGGSKGIPRKNLLKIGNLTIVERSLILAIKTSIIDDIVVSTDSVEIQNLVNRHGKFSPFIRPENLATDKARSLDVIKHALKWAEKNYYKKYDYIVLLEPPSPFRLPRHILKGIEIAEATNATSVVSLIEVGDYHPIRMKELDKDGKIRGIIKDEPDGVRRQDQNPVYIRNCAVYVFSTKTIKNNELWGSKPYGFEMNREYYSINIDEQNDFITAKGFYSKMKKENKLSIIEI